MSSPPLWKQYRDRLDALYELQPNFDLERRHEYTEANGWHIDEYEATLPPEPPGQPLPGGSWEIARQLIHDYKFPPPEIITGIYYPDRPLSERVMLLQARFLFLTFHFGVRVGGVLDEERITDQGVARIWGFNYQTLEGHFERGQMNFEVWKWVGSGEVSFRIHAFSRPNRIGNPFLRLGFALFGRSLQRRFANRCLERMQRFVNEALEARRAHEPPPPQNVPALRPASASEEAAEKMDEVEKQAEATY